jgi:hypothetical protein
VQHSGLIAQGCMQGYAVNVPLTDGLDDEMFVHHAFVPVMDGVMAQFAPTAIVLQCGADSLAGDKIGKFNLTTQGHAEAGRYLREVYPNVPVMMLGGGGYTISNVARTWSYETVTMLGYQDDQIPHLCPIVRFLDALNLFACMLQLLTLFSCTIQSAFWVSLCLSQCHCAGPFLLGACQTRKSLRHRRSAISRKQDRCCKQE